MMFNCCLVPCQRAAKVRDTNFERRSRHRRDSDGEYVRWRRVETKSKQKTKKRSSKKKKSEASTSLKKYDRRQDEDEVESGSEDDNEHEHEEDDTDEDETDEEDEGGEEGRRKIAKRSKEKRTKKGGDASFRSERLPKKDKSSIFRESETPSIKSDPLPASLPTSILAESFYSDDSLAGMGDLTFEVDYGRSTPLFDALEQNDWGNVLFFLRTGKFFSGGTLLRGESIDSPDSQARTWVHCQDDRGELLWRQLPLHAAICLAAPLVVVQRLAQVFPEAKQCRDSFGNLPANLAAKLHGRHSWVFKAVGLNMEQPERVLPSTSSDGSCERINLQVPNNNSQTPSQEEQDPPLTLVSREDNTKDYRVWDGSCKRISPQTSSNNSQTPSHEEQDRPLTPTLVSREDNTKDYRVWERPQAVTKDLIKSWAESESCDSYSSEEDFEAEYKIYERRPGHVPDDHTNPSYDGDEVALVGDDAFELYYF